MTRMEAVEERFMSAVTRWVPWVLLPLAGVLLVVGAVVRAVR